MTHSVGGKDVFLEDFYRAVLSDLCVEKVEVKGISTVVGTYQ